MPERILHPLQFLDNSPQFSELEFAGSLSIDDSQQGSKEFRRRPPRRDRKRGENQKEFQQQLEAAGGRYIFANSIDDVVGIIEHSEH